MVVGLRDNGEFAGTFLDARGHVMLQERTIAQAKNGPGMSNSAILHALMLGQHTIAISVANHL